MANDMKALRFILWLGLFLGFYATFLVLYQHGPSGFVEGAKIEITQLRKLLGSAP